MKTKHLIALTAALFVAALQAQAGDPINVYSSGSTGADGPFAPEFKVTIDGTTVIGAVPVGTKLIGNRICVPLPANGLYNFTTVNIPAGYTVCFLNNNVGVTILATGDVTIAGMLSVGTQDTRIAILGNEPVDGYTGMNIPGPGGGGGGILSGSYRSFGGGPNGAGPNLSAGISSFCLPLVGGSGGGGAAGAGGVGGGVGGILYLATSTKITFTGGGLIDFSAYGPGGTPGMAALFANDIRGVPASTDNYRMLLSAMRHESYTPMSIYPMWPVGIIGNKVPRNPSVEIVKIGNQLISEIPAGQMFQMPSPGKYTLILETRNLPAGIAFNVKVYLLDSSTGIIKETADYTTFSPTIEVSPGVCQAKTDIDLKSGEHRIYATATAPIKVASAPSFEGSRIRNLCLRLDDDGKSWTGFETENGTVLSFEAAMKLAQQQNCWDFIFQYARTGAKG